MNFLQKQQVKAGRFFWGSQELLWGKKINKNEFFLYFFEVGGLNPSSCGENVKNFPTKTAKNKEKTPKNPVKNQKREGDENGKSHPPKI